MCIEPSVEVFVVKGEDISVCAILDLTMLTQDSNVAIETTLGTFTVELYWDHAPNVRKSVCEWTKPLKIADVQELCRAGQERLL